MNNDVIPQPFPVEVLLIGLSQLKHLKCERIFGFWNKDKIKYVKTPLIEDICFDYDKFQIPTCFVILTGTNELSNDDPLEMAYRYHNKVTDLQSKAPDSKINIILLPPRGDERISHRATVFNTKLQTILSDPRITMINIFEKFIYNGHIVDQLFEKDKKAHQSLWPCHNYSETVNQKNVSCLSW